MSEWRTIRLGDEVNLTTGYPFKSDGYVDDQTQPRLLRGDNIAQGWLRWDGAKRWSVSSTVGLDDYWLCAGDVVLAMDRPWIDAGLKFAVVQEGDLPSLLVQRVCRLRGSDTLDTGFLRCVIGGRDFTNYVLGVQTGTAVPHISRRQIEDYLFAAPDIQEQRAIAQILGTLGDKIELNRRTNETLEAMARAIFKSWFVDFDPVRAKASGEPPESICRRLGLTPELLALFPDSFEDSELGDIPKGWKTAPLSEISEVIMGQSPNGDTYNELSEGMPLINGPVEFGVFHPLKRKWTTNPIRVSEQGDLIVCVRGSTTGRHVKSDGVYCLGRGVASIRSRFGNQPYVDQVFEHNLDRMLTHATGSTFPSWSGPTLKQWPILLPLEHLMLAYGEVATSLAKTCDALAHEVDSLAETRDTLLPKLLSGSLICMRPELISEHA